MQKRRYTRIKAVESEILRMHSDGETHRSIAEVFGLEREQVKKFLKRHREKQAMLRKGESEKPKGRPRKDGQPPRQNPETELKRLRMENKLLRDFLQSIERKGGRRSSMRLSIVTEMSIRYQLCANSLEYPGAVTITL